MVLRFWGYFVDPVPGSTDEPWRLRKCALCFFLEDGTLSVVEPRQENSGLEQGTLLKRHRVAKADGSELGTADLRVGTPVPLYGRMFHIVGCDAFTRTFLEEQGVTMPDDLEWPSEPREVVKQVLALRQPPPGQQERLVPATHPEDRRQFLLYDGRVLRFEACWDDSAQEFGDMRRFRVLYFLADGTMEVSELLPRNSGRDTTCFLHRGHLPKQAPPVGVRPVGSIPSTASTEFYSWQDLRLGSALQVYGRVLLLCDCDNFTHEWYEKQLGVHMHPLQVASDDYPQQDHVNPPGSAGQAAGWLPPYKALAPRRRGIPAQATHKVLRFKARLLPKAGMTLAQHESMRRFVISFFEADGRVAIFEPPQPNTGLPTGKFLERRQLLKPGSSTQYVAVDFFVGAVIAAAARHFELMEADERTLRLMEADCANHPLSDAAAVTARLQAALAADPAADQLRTQLQLFDSEGTGRVAISDLQAALRGTGIDVSPQEVVTFARRWQAPLLPSNSIDVAWALAVLTPSTNNCTTSA